MRIDQLIFAANAPGGTAPFKLAPTALTIFIGPNNGGKSTALEEIQRKTLYAHPAGKVIADTRLDVISDEERRSKLDEVIIGPEASNPEVLVNVGRRGNHTNFYRKDFDEHMKAPRSEEAQRIFHSLLPYFVLNMNGKERFALGVDSAAQIYEKPTSTIAAIYQNATLREKVADIFHDAFGSYLLIDPTHLGTFRYVLSGEKLPSHLEDSFSPAARAFFEKCSPLASASDGTKAFAGIVTELLAGWADIIFIDEPEAFLHPGLAFALGREIGRNAGDGKQLFVATHSPQFLMGSLSSGVPTNVIRLDRHKGAVAVNLLDNATLKQMMSDPLLRSTNVLSGLFFNAAVVVEGDSDRAFYEEINARLNDVGKGIKHPLFINGHGKHTAPTIARTLRSAGVPCAIILDIDWLKEDGLVRSKYFRGIGLPTMSWEGAGLSRLNARKALEAKSKNYKREGGIDLLEGGAKDSANDFFDYMATYGLFTVRPGEVEAWLAKLPIERAKDGWLERIFAAMGSDKNALSYVHAETDDVWELIEHTSNWIKNGKRRGMEAVAGPDAIAVADGSAPNPPQMELIETFSPKNHKGKA